MFVLFKRSLPDALRKQLLRDFNFIGFSILNPAHPDRPIRYEDYMFMAYNLDPGSDDEEDGQ